MSRVSDVLIVGAGAFGLWTAWSCLKHGLSATVMETTRPGAGASGGLLGALAPHMPDRWTPKKAFQRDALSALPDAIAEIEEAGGGNAGYARNGRLQLLSGAHAEARAKDRIAAAALHWAGFGMLEIVDPPTDWFCPDDGLVLKDSATGSLMPAQLCDALQKAVQARGGKILQGAHVNAVSSGQVRTGQDRYSAGAVVVANGVMAFDLLEPLLGARIGRGEKGQAALLALAPDDVLGTNVPLIQTSSHWIVPQGRAHVSVGSTSEREYDHPTATDAKLDTLIAGACEYCPALRNAKVLARWAGVRPRGNARDLILGPVPDLPALFVAGGGFKTGLGQAASAGARIAEMIMGQEVVLPESFRVAAHIKASADVSGHRKPPV